MVDSVDFYHFCCRYFDLSTALIAFRRKESQRSLTNLLKCCATSSQGFPCFLSKHIDGTNSSGWDLATNRSRRKADVRGQSELGSGLLFVRCAERLVLQDSPNNHLLESDCLVA